MRAMVDQHEANFSLLDATTKSRAKKLAEYVRNDTRPGEQLRSMLDYYEAVREALDEKVAEVRSATEEVYAEAFDRLEQRKEELGVTYALPDRSAQLDQIRRTDNLAALHNQLSTVSDFRAEYLAELNDAAQEDESGGDGAPRQSEIFNVRAEISRHELETEEDVEAFASDLREKLLQRVQDNKIVIIK